MRNGLPGKIIAASIVLIFPLFFIGGPSYQSARSFKELWNFGHILFFALFAMCLYFHLLPRHWSPFHKICLTCTLVILAGAGIEFAQVGLSDRTVGWDDFFRDLVGGGIVFFWGWGISGKNSAQQIISIVAISMIAFIVLIPLGLVLFDEYQARKDFPLLSGFETRMELGRWRNADNFRLVESPVRKGKYSAEISLNTDRYSGVSLFYFPEDWRGKKALAFSVFNPGAPVDLHCRVHDRMHIGENQQYKNRFNDIRVLATGWNEIVISLDTIRHAPAGREMDLAHIRGFGLFVVEQPEKLRLYLDDVRLLE